MALLTADDVVKMLNLQPHPLEGGFFRETYRTAQTIPGRDRSLATAIYYMLTPRTCSRMHRLPTDELFHFYLGDPVRMLHLMPDGSGREVVLGTDLLSGQRPQVLVPGGVWQGAVLIDGGRWALLGTTMAPGFDYADYAVGDRVTLTAEFPTFADAIRRLTPEIS